MASEWVNKWTSVVKRAWLWHVFRQHIKATTGKPGAKSCLMSGSSQQAPLFWIACLLYRLFYLIYIIRLHITYCICINQTASQTITTATTKYSFSLLLWYNAICIYSKAFDSANSCALWGDCATPQKHWPWLASWQLELFSIAQFRTCLFNDTNIMN